MVSAPRPSSPKLEDYKLGLTPVEKFCVVNRDVLLSVLDAVLRGDGNSDWTIDAARTLHFGLVNGLGTVDALLDQIAEEGRHG